MQYLLRRKITGIIIAIVAVPSVAFTQTFENLNQVDHDEKNLHFGINVGMNRSHYNFTHHPRFLQYDAKFCSN